MPWWGWLAAAAGYLLIVRWCLRWCRELQPDIEADLQVTLALFLWWAVIPSLFPEWLKKRGLVLEEGTLRRLVGESGWHRAERLHLEHQQRCQEMGMPQS